MEKNTVILEVDKYNELRDFRKNIEDGKVFCSISSNNGYHSQKFYTNDEAIKAIEEVNKELKESRNELYITVKSLEAKLKQAQEIKTEIKTEIKISDLKKMSWWELYKLRKNG